MRSWRVTGRVGIVAGIVAAVALCAGLAYLLRRVDEAPRARLGALPQPGSAAYREMVSAFNAGVAALDVDAPDRAKAHLTLATELVPGEPAAWADRAHPA
jgi:hypothetical protein